jgi:aminopeptidase YwaD
MKTPFSLYLVIGLLSTLSYTCLSQRGNPEVTPEELRTHIKFLSSDSLEGRRAGTPGNEMAAGYIAQRFTELGLLPAGDNGTFIQKFPFTAGAKPGAGNSLTIEYGGKSTSFTVDENFRPLAFSSDTSLSAPLVFAGYGITDTAQSYDDYAGIDVTGKIAVVLRFSPGGDNPHSPFVEQSSLRVKTFNAREHGAAGLILVTGPTDTEEPKLVPFSFDQGFSSSGLPVVSIGWKDLDAIFISQGKQLKTIQEGINTETKPNSFSLEATASLKTSIEKIMSESANVIGKIEGYDPVLKDEYIVIGAHFDHLGMGGQGSLAPDTVAVHHGADDNASGSAGMLEAAENLAADRKSLPRSVLFIGFSGEEMGLLGSNFYVNHPTVPLNAIKAMINLDMIGRIQDRKLVVEGVGTSPGFEELVTELNADSTFDLSLKPGGYGPSDHSSFYGKDIPTLFFFTNLHSDYHKPSDTWDKINYEGETGVVQFVLKVARKLDTMAEAPAFSKVTSSAPQGDARPMRVRLGVIPDYAEDVPGLKINGTQPDSPAEKGGLMGGDIIVKFGEKTIANIYDFTYVVSVEVLRGEKHVTLTVTLGGR